MRIMNQIGTAKKQTIHVGSMDRLRSIVPPSTSSSPVDWISGIPVTEDIFLPEDVLELRENGRVVIRIKL